MTIGWFNDSETRSYWIRNENGIMGWRVSVDEFGGGGWVARVEMDGLSMGVGDDTWVNVE